jgi:hydrogenase/urease accessory protein HupE
MNASLRAALLAALLAPSIALAHGISDADKQAMLEGGYFQYAVLGAKHMLTGYDHLLFLFGVVFFLTKFGDIVKFVTAFTVGHCITLITALACLPACSSCRWATTRSACWAGS